MAKKRTALDLNTATEAELAQIEGIDRDRARAIVEQREERGGFESWDDVREIPGIGERLVEKLMESATIESSEEVEAEAGDEGELAESAELDGEGEELEDEDEEDLEPEIESLLALAQMDSEAALAYETAAELCGDEHVAETLRGFGNDHQRHVKDIGQVLSARGVELTLAAPEPETSTFVTMAASVSSLGLAAALRAMIANEQFTNATYDTALDLISDPDAHAVLERNFADEQRHLQWLTQELARNRQAAEEAASESAQP